MSKPLTNKNILLGVSAGIAAYKTPDLVRKLTELGAQVRVVLSKNTEQFVTPLSLQAVSGNSVHHYAMTADSERGMGHIDLARWADLVLIAPATANFIARLCHGQADELLTTICTATSAPLAIAPAMNQQMWLNQANQSNINLCQERGVHIFGPDHGDQACGEVGPGRMLAPTDIAEKCGQLFSHTALTGRRVLLTAGPTWEAIDPVRGITNHSSGLMGYNLAQAAIEAGAEVTLVTGPTALTPPAKARTIQITSADEMHQEVMRDIAQQDVFVAVAAVSDYKPVQTSTNKIKKSQDTMVLELVKNVDILAAVAALEQRPFCVGFAAETNHVISYARKKLEQKKLDLIAANHVGGSETGFGTPDNIVTLISATEEIEFPRLSKANLARKLIEEIAHRFTQ